jgi:hypothetical protein
MKTPLTHQQRVAAAIANARGKRRGVPTIVNILDVLPPKLLQEVTEEADAVLDTLGYAELVKALKDVGRMAHEEVDRPGDNDQRFRALIRIRNFVGNSLAIAKAEGALSTVKIGDSTFTRDLVWHECGRGLSLSGKWLYCPSCGLAIDQESYRLAVEQAHRNGASKYYRDPEMVEELQRKTQIHSELLEALKEVYALIESGQLRRNTSDDPNPDFAARQIPFVTAMAKMDRAIAKAEGA